MKNNSQTVCCSPHSAGRVLVVDDHRQARESMTEVLRAAGYEALGSASAFEALRILEREKCDCIVTDLKMPGMDGIEFMIQIEQRRLDAQVVMVTAHASVATAVEAMRHRRLRLHRKTIQRRSARAARRPGAAARRNGAAGRAAAGAGQGSGPAGNDRPQRGHAQRCASASRRLPPRPRRCSSPAKAGPARNSSPGRFMRRATGPPRNSSA